MESLISTFHIQLSLIVAQLVNFGIVLLILYRFTYRPILKTLNDRTRKIEKGIRDADAAKKKLEAVAEKEKDVLVAARKEAQEIIARAEKTAEKDAERIVIAAKDQTEKLLLDAQKTIEQEKDKVLGEVKADIAELVVAAAEKIVAEKMNANRERELIEQAIK